MILQSLNDLYSRIASDPDYEIAPPGFSNQKISFRIVVKPDGNLFEIEMRVSQTARVAHANCDVPGETKPSGPGINPAFFGIIRPTFWGCSLKINNPIWEIEV